MDITKLTITELKAMAYDQLVEQELIQKNLNLINIRIAKLTEDAKDDSLKQV